MRGLAIGGVGPVIPNLRIGENNDPAGIRWIGEYFLVAGDGGVEHDLAGALGGRTKTPALEDAAVFQGKDGGWQLDCPPDDWMKPGSSLDQGYFSSGPGWRARMIAWRRRRSSLRRSSWHGQTSSTRTATLSKKNSSAEKSSKCPMPRSATTSAKIGSDGFCLDIWTLIPESPLRP